MGIYHRKQYNVNGKEILKLIETNVFSVLNNVADIILIILLLYSFINTMYLL